MKKVAHSSRISDLSLHDLLQIESLPAYIKQMAPRTLCRLIDHIGVEDCAEFMSIVDAQTMRKVLSVALWTRPTTGGPELLDAARFISWVRVWLVEGERATTLRLLDIEEDLLVAIITRLIDVRMLDATNISDADWVLGEFRMEARLDGDWQVLQEMFFALWQFEPDFSRRLLSRCESEQTFAAHHASDAHLANGLDADITFSRSSERDADGYVDPVHACAFLASARSRSLAQLRDEQSYDLETAEFFAAQTGVRERTYLPSSIHDLSYRIPGSTTEELPLRGAKHSDGGIELIGTKRDFDIIDAMLHDAGILEQRNHLLLELTQSGICGDEVATGELLIRALKEVFCAPSSASASSQRLRELTYLANIVMADVQIQGHPFREDEAGKFAIAVANLGACWLLGDAGEPCESVAGFRMTLDNDAGVVRLFRIGYHIICRIPDRCAEALEQLATIRHDDASEFDFRAYDESWSLAEVANLVRQRQFYMVRSLIDDFAVTMDSATRTALRFLIDATPQFPAVLDGLEGAVQIYVDKTARYISTTSDLALIEAFLKRLPQLCGA
ncbi:hypothetical protein AN416_37870 (plasmid) [Paraburkholderia caribensis]|nr:hypothetical protein AN416_37870 [Paraburkholderia caribensis]AUT57859.1 hypothetical protein C2L66_38845 [Paraburkholderia caribensis]